MSSLFDTLDAGAGSFHLGSELFSGFHHRLQVLRRGACHRPRGASLSPLARARAEGVVAAVGCSSRLEIVMHMDSRGCALFTHCCDFAWPSVCQPTLANLATGGWWEAWPAATVSSRGLDFLPVQKPRPFAGLLFCARGKDAVSVCQRSANFMRCARFCSRMKKKGRPRGGLLFVAAGPC